MGLGDTQRVGNSRGHIALPGEAQQERPEFERKLPNEGRLVAAGGQSGRLFRETGPGKKV